VPIDVAKFEVQLDPRAVRDVQVRSKMALFRGDFGEGRPLKSNCVHLDFGAGDGNRTHVRTLGRCRQVRRFSAPQRESRAPVTEPVQSGCKGTASRARLICNLSPKPHALLITIEIYIVLIKGAEKHEISISRACARTERDGLPSGGSRRTNTPTPSG
jgi:hypothetical protein